MISKELLSVVLNKKVIDDGISSIELKESTITFIEDYWDEDEGPGFYRSHTINVYELANKCKEWAYSTYGIMIQSYPYCGKGRADAIKGLKVDEAFKEKTEPEAIFKAAQWVLDNTSTNKLKGH